jgi:hypothetical protein
MSIAGALVTIVVSIVFLALIYMTVLHFRKVGTDKRKSGAYERYDGGGDDVARNSMHVADATSAGVNAKGSPEMVDCCKDLDMTWRTGAGCVSRPHKAGGHKSRLKSRHCPTPVYLNETVEPVKCDARKSASECCAEADCTCSTDAKTCRAMPGVRDGYSYLDRAKDGVRCKTMTKEEAKLMRQCSLMNANKTQCDETPYCKYESGPLSNWCRASDEASSQSVSSKPFVADTDVSAKGKAEGKTAAALSIQLAKCQAEKVNVPAPAPVAAPAKVPAATPPPPPPVPVPAPTPPPPPPVSGSVSLPVPVPAETHAPAPVATADPLRRSKRNALRKLENPGGVFQSELDKNGDVIPSKKND